MIKLILIENKTQILLNRAIFFLALVGFAISAYLFYTYVQEKPIVCLNTGCEVIRDSPYSYIFGIPLPAFGLAMYLLVIVVSFLRTTLDKKEHISLAKKLIFISSALGFLTSAYLTYLEAFVIKAYCIWCVASAIVVTLIFILSAYELRRFK